MRFIAPARRHPGGQNNNKKMKGLKMNLEKFNFNGNNVTVITDEVNNPWWIAKEVCEVSE